MDILERINNDMNSRPSEVTAWRNTMHDARAEIERLRTELKDTQWQLLRAQRALGYSEPERDAEQKSDT